MTDAFRALADPLRRLIVDELDDGGDMTLHEVCARLALRHGNASTRQAVSHHLRLLEDGGIIATERRGRTKIHRLRRDALRAVADRWPTAARSTPGPTTLRICQSSVFVDDQRRALDFYTSRLGFTARDDEPAGDHRWITVAAPDDPSGPILVLEPDGHPAIRALKASLMEDGVPFTAFTVDDVHRAHADLAARGVVFTQDPVSLGRVTTAVLDDTCGNLVQISSTSKDRT